MHIVTPTPGGVGLYLTPNIIAWLFFSWLLATSLWQITKSKTLNFSAFHGTILCAMGLLIIPMFYTNSSSINAIPRLLTMLAGFALLLSLSQLNLTRQGKSNLLLLLLLAVFIEAIIGFIQLFILMPFNISVVGYSPVAGRPYGSFTQPNVMASFLATGLAMVFYLLLPGKLIAKEQKKFYLCFLFCCSFAFALLIVVLQSKTGYLGGLVLLGLFFPSFIKHRKLFKLPLMALVGGILVGIMALNTITTVDRGEQLYKDRYRSDMYHVSTQLFTDNPLQGVGYGNFERHYREKHLSLMASDDELQPPAKNLRHPHSEILLWLSEGGIVALVALIVCSLAYLRLVIKLPHYKALPLLALITPIFIHSQTEFPFYHSVVHWFYFIVFIWLTQEASVCTQKHLSIKRTGLFKVTIIVATILTSLFMLTTLHTSIQMQRFKVSGNNDIELLNNVVNRIAWQEYFEVTLYSYYLNKGFTQKNENALLAYIDWASAFVKQTPRKALYQNMIVAIKTLESNGIKFNSKLKDNIYNEATTLYPSFIKAENNTLHRY
jgi:O-antigen polymerase